QFTRMPHAIDFENTSADIGSSRSSRFGLPPLQQLISEQLLCALFGYPATPPLAGNSTEPFALSPWLYGRSMSARAGRVLILRAVNGYGCALSRLRFAGYGCALSRLRFADRPCSRGIMPCNLS